MTEKPSTNRYTL